MTATIRFPVGYIADPYWIAQEKRIDIEKKSGINRVRSQERRAKALDSYLKSIDMTLADFRALEEAAKRPFYTVADLKNGAATGGHPGDEIVIPPHQLYGMCAQGCDQASSAIRLTRRDQLRSVVKIAPVFTGKAKPDGVFERFVTVTGGTGAKLSNQRGIRHNAYLAAFEAQLIISFSDDMVAAPRVKEFIAFCGREVGVGACRKMDYGRFDTTWV